MELRDKQNKAVWARRAQLKLLPCPFCGGEAEWGGLTRAYDFDLAIECTQCGINTGPILRGKAEEAKAARIWNRRAGALNAKNKPHKIHVDDAVLAILSLNLYPRQRGKREIQAATEVSYKSLERLHQSKMLAHPPSIVPGRDVWLTTEGARRARELFSKLFCD